MALPPSTANWHWKNKNITSWGKEWFERELPLLKVTGDGGSASISQVTYVEGDVELGQRKSKLITIYDCKIEADWTGTTADGTEVKGKLTIPEVSHEMIDGLSEYIYQWSLTSTRSTEVDSVFMLVKASLPSLLEAKFSEFPAAIRETHGKDLTVSADPSRSGTPAPAAPASTDAGSRSNTLSAAGPTTSSAPKQQKPLNTSVITVEATFMAAAEDLYGLLTDDKRIPAWSRAPAQSTPEVGKAYSIFGGGVKGSYTSLSPPKEIVQTWSLSSPTWPSGHGAELTTTLDQSSDSTKVTFSLSGVPKGMEDEIKRNLEGYYIHGLKSIGYVQVTPYELSSRSQPTRATEAASLEKTATRQTLQTSAIVMTVLVFVAAVCVPYFSLSASRSK